MQSEITQVEWLKRRIAELQLPPNKQDHDTREKWLIECGMPAEHEASAALTEFANRMFHLHGFMLLHGGDEHMVTIKFPDLKEAQQFHDALVELSTHKTEAGQSRPVSPSPISADAVVEACATDAKPIASWREQAAFEEWAKDSRYDMTQHPLHYLFVDKQTNAARQGWKAALAFVRALKGTFPAAPEAKSEVALVWNDSCPTASVAVTPFCRYVVWPDGALSGHGKTQYLGSVPSAKAAAQTDYETRRSALVDPEGGV